MKEKGLIKESDSAWLNDKLKKEFSTNLKNSPDPQHEQDFQIPQAFVQCYFHSKGELVLLQVLLDLTEWMPVCCDWIKNFTKYLI